MVRGPLKFTVETSSPQVEAGKKFSVSVRVSNPYDVPVVVKRVETKLPAKFVAATAKKGFLQEGQDALDAMVREKSLRPLVTSEGGQVVQAAGVGDAPDGPVELQPGNSTVRVFTIRTSNAIFFAPSLYNLNLAVEYEIDGKLNHDTVAYQMNVRAPLSAMISGSIIGSVIGYLVRAAKDETVIRGLIAPEDQYTRFQFAVGLLTAVLVAGIVVVAFARKKEAQPILSIEDFWGGLFVGFLSAYGGGGLLDRLMGPPPAT